MHLNPQHPNILHDMQAAANGRDLRDGQKMVHPQTGRVMTIPCAKRHLIPRKSYPYASERQVQRQRRRAIELGIKPYIDWDKVREEELKLGESVLSTIWDIGDR